MNAGFSGTYVISWSQTELDGLDGAPLGALAIGAAWSWSGDAVRVDGPNDVLRLEGALGSEDLRRRAARSVRRLVGRALEQDFPKAEPLTPLDEPLLHDQNLIVTDGARSYTITLIQTAKGMPPLLMFLGEIPPRLTDLWVVHHSLDLADTEQAVPTQQSVICFTNGTRIATPLGQQPVEMLREGDLVLTKDNGPQPIQWIGSRRMTGARFFAMPALRPIRFRTGALGIDRPDQELLVSPQHKMLVTGAVAHDLFNAHEVLVAAEELVNGTTISVDLGVREVSYIHLMFDRHQVIWANGVETESFHPASAPLSSLADADRARLLNLQPALSDDPFSYGTYARRNLSQSEAALLRFAA